jgi:hypothetical protein
MATSVMAFVALVRDHRFAGTRLVWLPKRRLPTPAFFGVAGVTRADRGRELPGAVARWVRDGRTLLEVIKIDPRVDRKRPARSGYAVNWIRSRADGSDIVLGTGKGVWDCQKRRLAMFYGSERVVADEVAAREAVAGQCRQRAQFAFARYGQDAVLCGPFRR